MSGSGEARSYLVECYWPGVTPRKHAGVARRVQAAASELRRQGSNVSFVGSILLLDDETVFCLLDGKEADVRAVSEQAGVPFERVLESLRIEGKQWREKE